MFMKERRGDVALTPMQTKCKVVGLVIRANNLTFARYMKQSIIIMALALLMTGCRDGKDTDDGKLLSGAWVLTEMEYPMGGTERYPINNMRLLRIYRGDSVMWECGLTQTPTALVAHHPYWKADITLISKGGGEYVYLEGDEPRPLQVRDDTTIVVQRNGVRYTWRRAESLYREWGEEIRAIVEDNYEGDETSEGRRFVLSMKEREQRATIHWLLWGSMVIVVALLVMGQTLLNYRRERRRLKLQLEQIREVKEHRPASVRRAQEEAETAFFRSDEYDALRRRIASGRPLTEADWQEVRERLKGVYPGFVGQLRGLYPMSELEMQVCMLTKLRIPPTDMASVLARDVSTISTVRSRLYGKVFGRKGGAREWDEFVLSIA